jgi:hypothetical protein
MARSRSRIETELSQDLKEQLNRLLLDGATYDEAADWCQEKGYDISRSSVGRYGKQFFEAYQNIRQFEDQSRAIMSAAEDGMPMEEAVGKLILQRVMAALVKNDADVVENVKIIGEIAKLQRSHVMMAKHKIDLENRAKAVADEVKTLVKKGGLSDQTADQIRKKILGIAK